MQETMSLHRTVAGDLVAGYLLAVPVDFRIALSRIRFSHHLLIRLQAGEVTGIGEGILYRTLPHQAADLFRRIARPAVEEGGLLDATPEEQETWVTQLSVASPALAYAVDTALWDLRGRKTKQPLADLLGEARRKRIPITEQILIQDWPTAEAELDTMLSRGMQRLKLKIGASPRADLEAIRRVRAFVGPGVELRVDANRAYTLADGEPLYKDLADLGVLALEEPLSGQDLSGLRVLRRRVGLPVILDENVQSLDDLQSAIAEEAIDVLNIKLTRVGGISRALRYAEVCYQHGVETAIGCSEDLGVGTAAILHTAAALPEVHSTEGVGPLRLGFDLTTERWELKDGSLGLPAGAGLGVTLPTGWVDRLPHRVRCFDLSEGRWQVQAFSHYARWFQRANNLLWRVWRRARR